MSLAPSSATAPARALPRSNWSRRLAGLSLACVTLSAVVSATLLSRSMSERMIRRNAELAQEFIDSHVRHHQGDRYFAGESETAGIKGLFAEIARMPGLIHANAYNRERRLVWSTNERAIGTVPGANSELDEALGGQLAIESQLLEAASFIKPEHVFVVSSVRDAIEIYIPVRDERGATVGVAELYMLPQALVDSVHEMTRGVWLACAGSGLFIFLALFGLVRQADRQIATQQRRLVESESLAAVGGMASAVAHGIRNPLASIRSSAELISAGPDAAQAQDIMSEVDRLQVWIRRLLVYAQPGGRDLQAVGLIPLLQRTVEAHAPRMERQSVRMRWALPETLPPAVADPVALEQAIDNLVSNALDAMPEGGTLRLRVRVRHGHLDVMIQDTGMGMDDEALARAFTPFHTSKRTGLGVGLALVKRTAERLGGSVSLRSRQGEGTLATLSLKQATPPSGVASRG